MNERARLGWGSRYLMCPPDHFDVVYEINPWMRRTVKVDRTLARRQWECFVSTLRASGAEVEELTPVPGLPDLVFCANAGIVSGRIFVPARFRHAERRPETPVVVEWFERRGYELVHLPDDLYQEGAGDALPFGGVLVCGYRQRSDARAATFLSEVLSVPTRSVELVDPRLYHLDLVFCPLDAQSALVAPTGLDRWGVRVLTDLVPDPIMLTADEALSFCANSVVVSDVVLMPHCTNRLRAELELRGFDVRVVTVGEFEKAGGALRCLTLAMDLDLAQEWGKPGTAAS
ncbi:MAG: amidinotransferase [Acidimicrobiales bacterium]|nr:MAG: amidinotransferase [Acidimicrobiales bacterium]